MTPRETAVALIEACRTGKIAAKLGREFGRCLQMAHGESDEFNFERFGTKLVMRHAGKPSGRKRHSAPSPYKTKIAQAAIWAQWDAASGMDETAAAAKRAKEYRVPQSAVFRAAFEKKDPPMTALMRQLKAAPDKFNQG